MRTCSYRFAGREARASWSLLDDALLLEAEGGAPLTLPLREVGGVSGDGYTLRLELQGGALELSRLGADGQTLLEHLNRAWPELRASALRLSGTGGPARFAGRIDTGAAPRPCVALLFEDALVAFPEGADALPLFLALQSSTAHEADGYTVALTGADGTTVRFSHLGGATEAFARGLTAARTLLDREASAAVNAGLPTLGALARATLSGAWLPGALRPLADLESLAPGFGAAFRASWLAACPRSAEGNYLLEAAGGGAAFLAFGRPGAAPETGGEEAGAEGDGQEASTEAPKALPEGMAAPWLLVRCGGGWALEALGETGRATYRFAGGEEMPGLCSRLLCAPQFSREALYLPLEKLVGERADFALPARELPFLRALRERVRGRVIHAGFEGWKAALGKG